MEDHTRIYTKKWPRKNLGELVNFLELQHPEGLSLRSLADDLDVTAQTVSRTFIRDDMKLSRAEEIAKAYGYELKLFYTEKEFLFEPINPVKRKNFPNAGNLAGLIKYIYDCNYSVAYVCTLANMNYNILMAALTNGDIFVSRLYEIVNALKIEVLWIFDKIDN